MSHEIFCPKCGHVFSPAEALFDLSRIFALDLEDPALGGRVPIPVLLSAKDLVSLSQNCEPDRDGWMHVSVSYEDLLKAIAGIDASGVEKDSESLRKEVVDSLKRSMAFREGVLDAAQAEIAARAYQKIVERVSTDSTLELKLQYTQADDGSHFLSSVMYKKADSIMTLRVRLCANRTCKCELAECAGRYEHTLIGMLGTTGTGKTSYMSALAYHLLVAPNPALYKQIQFRSLPGDEQWKSFTRWVLYYKYNVMVKKTEAEDIIPFFSVIMTGTDSEKINSRIISFVDIPGEIMHNAEGIDDSFVQNQRRIMTLCKLFILCIDPTQLAYGINCPEMYIKKENLTSDITQRDIDVVIQNVESILGVTEQSGRKQTLAVVLSKSDALLQLDTSVKKAPFVGRLVEDRCALNLNPIWQHRQRVIEYIEGVESPLISKLQELKSREMLQNRIAFFAVSAFGGLPLSDKMKGLYCEKPDKEIGEILKTHYDSNIRKSSVLTTPVAGVEEPKAPAGWSIGLPFLWLLACEGCFPVYHEEIDGGQEFFIPRLRDHGNRKYIFDMNWANPADAQKAGRRRGFFQGLSSIFFGKRQAE